MKLEETINDPNTIDWEYFWKKQWKKKARKKKDWNKVAKNFGKWIENDDYPEKLIDKIKVDKNNTVIDLGCGEGTITVPLAKKVLKLTAADLSEMMLEQIEEKAKKENLNNIKTLQIDIKKMSPEDVEKHDVVLVSRAMNGVYNIKQVLQTLDKIANKYVYITLFGPNNKKHEKTTSELLNKEYHKHPDHSYIYNLLNSIGISANVENLECESLMEYSDLDEALERYIWRLGDISSEEKEKFRNHMKQTFRKNENGKLENPTEKADWVLIWWKKD